MQSPPHFDIPPTNNPYAPMAGQDAAYPAIPADDLIESPSASARGPWGAWLRLTTPFYQPEMWRDARTRDRQRRARLLSIVLLGGVIVTLGLMPQVFFPALDITQLFVTLSALIVIMASAVLSRLGFVSFAAGILIAGITLAIAANQLLQPSGLPLSGRTAFDLFVIPILLAGVLLPRRMIFSFWLICAAFIILDLQFGAKQADLAAFIKANGLYTAAGTPIILLGVVALVAWLAAGSLRRAVLEADRTQELERAYQFIDDQKRQLEAAIATLQRVHAQAANGDLNARAPLDDEAMRPLAVSLNLMLERLSRARGAETALRGLEQRIQIIEQTTQLMARGNFLRPLPRQDLGRLAPLAQALEGVRVGTLGAFEQQTLLADQAYVAIGEYIHAVRLWVVALQQNAASYQDMEAISRAEHSALLAVDRCRQAARQFAIIA